MEIKQLYINHAYTINEDGTQITSLHTGNVITSSIQLVKGKQSGYYYATLCSNVNSFGEFITQTPKRIAVHRMVCYTWNGEPPTPLHKWVNHIDGNKGNNHYTNLEWTTIAENIQHAYDTGLKVSKKGEAHHRHGKTATNECKAKMSAAKLGANHPKFKGYYYANFKRFESANQAGKYLGIPAKTVLQRCKNEKFRLNGYYFVPKPE